MLVILIMFCVLDWINSLSYNQQLSAREKKAFVGSFMMEGSLHMRTPMLLVYTICIFTHITVPSQSLFE